MEPPARFALAPSSLPRKWPNSGTARAWTGAFGPARTGCLPFTRRLLYLVSYEGIGPPSGTDQDRPPYESGAAAVHGDAASGAGLEPAKAGVRTLLGTANAPPGTGREHPTWHWYGRRDSNSHAAGSEPTRYASSRHARKVRRQGRRLARRTRTSALMYPKHVPYHSAMASEWT